MTNETTPIHRPVFLLLLGIVSILANSVYIIIYIFLLSGISDNSFLYTLPVIDVIIDEGLHGNSLFFLLEILLHFAAIFSITLLIRMRRAGFYSYLAVQTALLALPFLSLRSLGISYLFMSLAVSLIFSLLFIFLFALYLKKMR
ncbi:MAG: hypothetical protein WCQ95_10355 [Bacteroidota bacterium]